MNRRSGSGSPGRWLKAKAAAAAVLTVVLLAGCAGGSAEGGSPGAGANAADSGSDAQAPLEMKMTVRLFDQVPDMDNPYWTEWQKRTNTKLNIEWIPDGDYTTKLNLILASGNLPDVLVANDLKSPPLINAVRNGAFWDLTPFLGDFSQYPNLKNNVAPDAWVNSRILGKNYGVPQNVAQVQSAPKIRKDWLDKLGIPMPQTLDDYRAALKKIVDSDVDGNGVKDTIGLVSKGDILMSTGGFGDAFGTTKPAYDQDGGLIYEKWTPQFTSLVEWFRQLYQDGILAKEFSVMKPTQAVELYEAGKVVSMVNESIRWDYPYTETIGKVQPGAVVDTVPPLQGPDGYAISRGTGIVGLLLISKQVPEEKVKRILDYFELVTAPEYYEFSTYGIEGMHYTKSDDGGYVLTEQHTKDLGSSAPWQPQPLFYDEYGKVLSAVAPKAYNDAKIKQVADQGYFDKGIVNPFSVINSDTWVKIWPKYKDAWTSVAVKAIVGQISMEEYKAYVDQVNADPQVKQAYQEFAQSYEDFFGGSK